MVIDTHSHLNDAKFDSDRDAVIARMREASVSTITVGTDLEMSRKAIEIAEKYNMWATVGQHPTDAQDDFDILKFRDLASNSKVVAIGECGLDYVQNKFSKLSPDDEKVRQKKLFQQHIALAQEVNKPLMIHCRDAYQDLLPMIPDNVRAHLHFFSGDWDIAKKCLDKGFTISFPGTITFSHDYDEVVKNVPIDMFTIETDSPYVAPVPYRGKRNEPVYVIEVAKKVAELRGISLDEVVTAITATAKRIFAL